MDAEEYRSLILANLKFHQSADEETLVRIAKQVMEVVEDLTPPEELVAKKSEELWIYYTTVRIPARARARGLWLKGFKGVMAKPGRRFIHLSDKALADFLLKTDT